jgi:soluble lytic murein transglycosylase
VLAPYLAYYQLMLRINEAGDAEVREFLQRYPDSLIADKLRGDWVKALGRKERWDVLLAEQGQVVNGDAEQACYALQARHALGDKTALREVKPLWLSAGEPPANCAALVRTLASQGQITQDEVWVRIRGFLEAGRTGQAKAAAELLAADQAHFIKLVEGAMDKPQRFLDKLQADLKTRAGREVTILALWRLARQGQAQAALPYWFTLRPNFSENEQAYFWGQMAYQAARRLDPDALAWYRKAGGLNEEQLAWWVRIALRQQEWNDVLAAIGAMSEQEQKRPSWRYWKARALKAMGQPGAANQILAPLSVEFNYHGQLAAEELGTVIGNPLATYRAGEEDIQGVAAQSGIQRALALYQFGVRYEANREWLWATRHFDDRQLLAAAELARRHDWPDRAINTADKTKSLHDFSLRYPLHHRELLAGYSRQWELDESWVYGLIRQESRFMHTARSSAGASGLMQIMPATAKWVAKKLGARDFRQSLINQLDTNIEFGTYYLRYVLDDQGGHPVLATAAYNAGPGRARRWRDMKPLEGAVYTESIPFNETRDYVQKVMSNANYYAQRLGQGLTSISSRLGIVKGRDRSEPAGSSMD